MVAIDRWALQRTAALHEEIVEAYRKYEYHLIYQKVHNFCVVDLGGFYLDLLKDRLYTTPKKGVARRSAQTALFHIAESMVRWLAPILSYTADEIWSFLPGKRSESVFLETWHVLPKAEGADPIDWNLFIQLKAAVAQELEKLRVAGTIGSSLDAEVEVFSKDEFLEKLKAVGEELRFLLITSKATVKRVSNAAGPPVGAVKVADIAKEGGVWVRVQASPAPKCERCWHHRRGCRVQSRASDHLRTLRGQRHGPGRISTVDLKIRQPFRCAKAACAWLWIAALIIVLDQLTKLWIVDAIPDARLGLRAAGAQHHPHLQPGRRLEHVRGCGRRAALGVVGAGHRRVDRARLLVARLALASADAADHRTHADPRRRHRQRHRPAAPRRRHRLRAGALGQAVLSGVQRGGLGHHRSARPACSSPRCAKRWSERRLKRAAAIAGGK